MGIEPAGGLLMPADLTIVIPARNEAAMLPRLLQSLLLQDIADLPETRIILADAGSTDGTTQLALSFGDRLSIEVTHGGLPAVGRNAGARLATTPFVLFLDADVELRDCTLLRRALVTIRNRQLHLVTVSIACRHGNLLDDTLYLGSNTMQRISSFLKPFATGMFMLFDRQSFLSLGGFNERALFAEDYLLSKRVATDRFCIVRGKVFTTNRRFRKIGHSRMVWMFFRTMLHSWDEAYFLRDHDYWREAL